MAKKKAKQQHSNTIAVNRRARFEYFLEGNTEAGIVLEGWEVKSLRAGQLNLTDSYVNFKNGEAWLHGSHIAPLNTASTHITPEPDRARKLLLHAKELSKFITATTAKGFTCLAISIYWKHGLVKVDIALGKGKQLHDKRATQKDREWGREKHRELRQR
ncbi:MAG: SsrA-binding protein [Moraxellaceae bacterium]|nr:MAG: SsrA-binding protein [Moraxellaceae bacterium]PCJ13300.1 MAG: SsrA-binding protein [Gammaproteobacteria bacterium]